MDDDDRTAGSHDDAASAHDHTAHPGYADHRAAYLARLRRIEGQVRGVARMVDEDVYCIDVLTQISAVNSALRSVAVGLLDQHLRHCVQGAASEDPEQAGALVEEATRAIERLIRA